MALPTIWYGTQAFVSIQRAGDAAPVNFSGKIKKFDVGGGDRNVEDIYTFGNNTITKQLRADQLEISMTALTTDTLFRQMWAGGTVDTTEATTAGILVSGTASTRDPYRIILMIKDGLTDTLFAGTTCDFGVATYLGPCVRYAFTDCYAVTVKESLEADGNFEVELTFKLAASGIAVESASTTTYGISALSTATYT